MNLNSKYLLTISDSLDQILCFIKKNTKLKQDGSTKIIKLVFVLFTCTHLKYVICQFACTYKKTSKSNTPIELDSSGYNVHHIIAKVLIYGNHIHIQDIYIYIFI